MFLKKLSCYLKYIISNLFADCMPMQTVLQEEQYMIIDNYMELNNYLTIIYAIISIK